MFVFTVTALVISKKCSQQDTFYGKAIKYTIIPFLISTMFSSDCHSAVEYTYTTVIGTGVDVRHVFPLYLLNDCEIKVEYVFRRVTYIIS